MFVATEEHNPGLFDINNDKYYETITDPICEMSWRMIRNPITVNILIDDEELAITGFIVSDNRHQLVIDVVLPYSDDTQDYCLMNYDDQTDQSEIDHIEELHV